MSSPGEDHHASGTEGVCRQRRCPPWRSYAFLAVLVLVLSAANLAWLKADTRPPSWDPAGHAIATIRLSRVPLLPDPLQAVQQWFTQTEYPPLVYWLSAPLAHLFWPSADTFAGIHALFLAILLLATYGVARSMGGTGAGLVAACVVGLYPILYGLERHYLLDFPLTAMVALSNWLLIRSEGFRERRTALVYGASLGLGMLTKWPFALFVAGPFLVTVAFRVGRERARWKNLLWASGTGFLVAAPWYIANFRSTIAFAATQSAWAQAEGDPLLGSIVLLKYYALALVEQQILLPFAALALLGLLVVVARRGLRHDTLFLLSWIALPYLYFTFAANKDPRFTVPYLTALAIFSALGLAWLKPRAVRAALTALIALYALLQFSGLSWGMSQRLPSGVLPSRFGIHLGSHVLPIYSEVVHMASPAAPEDWQEQAMLHDLLATLSPQNGTRHAVLSVLANAEFFEPNAFTYYALAERLPVDVLYLPDPFQSHGAREKLAKSDYVITKTGDLGPAWTTKETSELTRELLTPLSELGSQFELVGGYPLPDGSEGRLYRRVQ